MKKKLGNITFYGVIVILCFYILCQVGLIPLKFVVILSGSMSPTINPGDVAIIHITDNPDLSPGKDIILFQDGKTGVVHRVYDIKDHLIITKGDANNSPDLVMVSVVKGIYLGRIPWIGHPIIFLQNILHSIFRS